MRARTMIGCAVLAALLMSVSVATAIETEVVFEGDDADSWDTARDSQRLAAEFSLSELAPSDEGGAIKWRFVSRGIGFNDIFLRKEVVRPFDTIRVRVRNLGATVTLASKVRDATGGEWTANGTRLEAGADWQWVQFPWDQWKVASWSRDADGRMDFPLGYFVLIAFDVKGGPEYHLQISRVEALRPEPPVATIHEFTAPANMRAGQDYTARLSFSLDKPCREDRAEIVLRHGKVDVWKDILEFPGSITEVKPGQVVTPKPVQITVPRYAFGGPGSLLLRLGEAHIELNGENADEEVAHVTIEAREPGKTTSEVKLYKGAPTLFINDQPHNGMAYTAYGPSVQVFNDFTEAEVNLYSFSATPTEAGYGLSRTSWVSPDEYDFSQLDERVLMVLEANPDAYIFPRLYIHAPKWWSEEHPDDVVQFDPGDGNYETFIHSGGKPAPSWASEQWRKDTVAGLRKLIAHVEASPYADRVIGYHIASGTTEEWMMWGANENQWVGYSPVNVARFRNWLRGKYGDDAALQKAWGDGDVTLGSAQVPPKSVRAATKLGSLRDPDQEQSVIDFYLYNSALVADTICYFAEAVKDITRREKTVGVFYGYLLQLCGEQRQQNAGHLALEEVLQSPDVDFLCSPTSYAFRQLGGEGTSHFMSLLGSVKLHGKLWFNENDIRTSLAPGEVGSWGKPENVDGDILQQDKELANAFVNGAAQWWFDVGANRYDDPRLMDRIYELTQNATEVRELDRSPAEQVAMIVDEKSLCYLRVGDRLGTHLLVGQLPQLHRIGAPVGHYLVGDLPKLADHKVFFIMTSFAPTDEDRKAIDALKRDGNVLVFCYAPGLYRNGHIDEAAMAELTGIDLKLSREPMKLRVSITEGHAISEGIAGVQYGGGEDVSPVCYADDAEATVIGTLPDGKPGLVVKQFEDWTSVHTAAGILPASLMRRIAQFAGVHIYIDTEDVVWAAKNLLAVSVKDAGSRTIRIPGKADVRDLYSGESMGEGIHSFSADFAPRATRVFVTK